MILHRELILDVYYHKLFDHKRIDVGSYSVCFIDRISDLWNIQE
jgi:hypothetical protein